MMARPRLYLAAAWLMPAAVLSQIGLALFGVPLAFHGLIGAVVGLLSLLLIRLALVTPASHSQRALAVALGLLIGLQPCLIALRLIVPAVGALHAVNAFVILGVALALALDVDETQTASSPDPRTAGSGR
jgi:hypothetical protein